MLILASQGCVAQRTEQLPSKQRVVGSNPTTPTNRISKASQVAESRGRVEVTQQLHELVTQVRILPPLPILRRRVV